MLLIRTLLVKHYVKTHFRIYVADQEKSSGSHPLPSQSLPSLSATTFATFVGENPYDLPSDPNQSSSSSHDHADHAPDNPFEDEEDDYSEDLKRAQLPPSSLPPSLPPSLPFWVFRSLTSRLRKDEEVQNLLGREAGDHPRDLSKL